MSYIWNNPEWPLYTYDGEEVERYYGHYLLQKKAIDIVFGILIRICEAEFMLVHSLMRYCQVSRLRMRTYPEIEDENISYDSVYSSICKRLDIYLDTKTKTDQYAEDVSKIALDATGNLEKLSTARIKQWHSLLFSSMAGIKPKVIGDYRIGPVNIRKGNGRESEIIYEGLPAERIHAEMERLIGFINEDNEKNPLVKSAVVSLWFLCIYPFEDGNGRISRAISDYVLSKGFNETHRVFSMSSLILKSRADYYELLHAISTQFESLNLTRWIVWNIDIAIQAKVEALKVYEKSVKLTRFMKNLDPSVYNSRELSMLFKLADGSFYGKLSTDTWAKMNKCSPAAASRDIQHLLQEGFLIPSGDTGPKTGYYLDPELIEKI